MLFAIDILDSFGMKGTDEMNKSTGDLPTLAGQNCPCSIAM